MEEHRKEIEDVDAVIELLKARTDNIIEGVGALANTIATITMNHRRTCEGGDCVVEESIIEIVEGLHDLVHARDDAGFLEHKAPQHSSHH